MLFDNSGEKQKSSKVKLKNKAEVLSTVSEKTTIVPPKHLKTYAESCATVHCFHNKFLFTAGSLVSYDEPAILLADKKSSMSLVTGEVNIEIEHAIIRLEDV